MLYVIEGLDGTGKTTLAAELSHVLKAPVLKSGAGNSHNDYIDDMIIASTIEACQPERDIILDRSIFSGLSYGQIGPVMQWLFFTEWLDRLAGIPLTVIHLTADEATRLARDVVGTKGTRGIELDRDIDRLVSEANKEGAQIAYKTYDTGRMQPGHIVENLLRAS